MSFFKPSISILFLSLLLTGCGGGSSSSDTDIESGDTGSSDTGSSDTGSSDTGSSDTGSSDTGSSDTGSSDTGNSEPTVITTHYTHTRVFAGETLTINFTATETHQNNSDLVKYRVWDYLNPATIQNGSADQKIYYYDQYTDIDEEALGLGADQGFTKDDSYRRDTHSYSNLATVNSNQFIMVTTETVDTNTDEIDLNGILHHKIESQTFSNDTPPELIDEEWVRIAEEIGTLDPCAEDDVSLGEFVRYVSKGFWQIGDTFELVADIHSPTFQCVDGNPQYLGHVSILTTATSQLTGYLNQVSSQGKSFNSVLQFTDSEVSVNQETGNKITRSNSQHYMQLHTGEVANIDEFCLISQTSQQTEFCSTTKEVASNLPTIPTL